MNGRFFGRLLRRRVIVGVSIAAVVLGGAGATLLRVGEDPASATGPAAVPAAVVITEVSSTPDAAAEGVRNRLTLVLFSIPSLVAGGADKAPVEQLAALQAAFDAGQAALAGGVTADMLAAMDAVNTARGAVEVSVAGWSTEQARVATEAAAAEVAAAQARAAADAAKQARAATAAQRAAEAQAAPQAAPRTVTAAPKVAVVVPLVPEKVGVKAPVVVPVPVDPILAARSANDWYAAALESIGATGATFSNDWASCLQPDLGPTYIQGCAQSNHPGIIYMKVIDAALARTEVARGVVIHEWAHLLQYGLGYYAVRTAADRVFGAGLGIEQSADCMAIQLGAQGKPGGYTDDCSGARGELAASFLAGVVP